MKNEIAKEALEISNKYPFSPFSAKHQIIERAKKLRAEITQAFLDAEHWNKAHPNETPLDADPDGELKKIAFGIDKMLEEQQA